MSRKISTVMIDKSIENVKYLPSREYLNECFHIKNGCLIWKKRPVEHFENKEKHEMFNNARPGTEAGRLETLRHYVSIKEIQFLTTHVLWKLVTGENPTGIMLDEGRQSK